MACQLVTLDEWLVAWVTTQDLVNVNLYNERRVYIVEFEQPGLESTILLGWAENFRSICEAGE